jgi:hypothetical protein
MPGDGRSMHASGCCYLSKHHPAGTFGSHPRLCYGIR